MPQRRERGVTLVELIIAVTIAGILLAMGLPSYRSWIQNAQIRTASEAIQNGLQLARAEAVRRNTLVSFQLTTTLDGGCALSTTGNNWVVGLDNSAAGACDQDPSDTVAPRIIQKRAAAEGTSNATVNATQSVVTFNGMGRRVTPAAAAGDVQIDIENPSGGTCLTAGGTMRCMRIVVSTGGQIRMCDPRWSAANNPEGC